jgi:hypothetical protein
MVYFCEENKMSRTIGTIFWAGRSAFLASSVLLMQCHHFASLAASLFGRLVQDIPEPDPRFKHLIHDSDLGTSRRSSGRELCRISRVLHPIKEAADAPVDHGCTKTEPRDEMWADASEEDELEVFSAAASCPVIPPESNLCLDGPPDAELEAFKDLTPANARMDASIITAFEQQNTQGFALGGIESVPLWPPQSIYLQREN